ncbi:MAG: YCF48-related protein [Planctomycetota bacterium]|jgi:photosystem II stability/assembly factor-like uncharacterized protein
MVIGTAPVGATSWFPLDSGTDQNLEAVQFPVDDQTGYAAGGPGTILKTTDGGETWVAQTSGSAAGLRGMCFVNASIGFVVGSGGEILRTDDGGATWVPQTSNTTEVLRDVVFPVDDQTGYISGDNGTILKTVDGGANWSAQSSGTTMDLLGLDFPVDNQTGYAAGWAGEMVKTTDGGANWSGLNSGTTTHLYDIKFPVDTQTGYACGNAAEMYRTTDGGATWTLEITGGAATLYAMCSPSDAVNGYAVGFIGDIVQRTSESWWLQRSGTTDRLYDVDFPGGGSVGYTVGWYGRILKTTDGGGGMMTLHPTGDGSVNGFTTWFNCPSGTWDCVNDQTGNAASGVTEPHDGNTTYLADSKPNTNREMFALDDGLIPSGATVNTIEIIAQLGKSGQPPTASLSYQRIGTDGSPIDTAPVTISASDFGFDLNVIYTCLNWTATDIDNLEIGVVHTGGGDLYLTQIRVRVTYDLTGTVYRSIGTNAGTLYSTGTATVNDRSRTVTFGGGAVLPTDVGVGDRLTVSGEQFYILSRNSDTEVTVQEIPCTDYVDQAYTIERAYNTMPAWVLDRQGDLVAESRQEVGVVYNDGPFIDRLDIFGSTTDASHYMRLTVADGHGHSGLKDTGAVIDAGGGWGGLNAIDVLDEYTRIEGLEIKGIQDAGSAVYFAADNGLVDGIFVHSCWQNNNAGVDIDATNVTVRNSFFTGGTSAGVRVLANATGIIENCTMVGNGSSGYGIGDDVGSTTSVSNTISVNHPSDNDFVLWSNISFFGNNMYSSALGIDPGEDDGGHQAPPGSLEALFVSFSGEDYHLEASGHMAGGSGLDLSSSFTDDIDGDSRLTPWDIGADDDGSASSGGGSATPRIVSWREVAPN